MFGSRYGPESDTVGGFITSYSIGGFACDDTGVRDSIGIVQTHNLDLIVREF